MQHMINSSYYNDLGICICMHLGGAQQLLVFNSAVLVIWLNYKNSCLKTLYIVR